MEKGTTTLCGPAHPGGCTKHAVKGGFFQQSKAYPVCAAKIGYFGAKAAVFIFAQKDMLKLRGCFPKVPAQLLGQAKEVVIFLFFSVQVYILRNKNAQLSAAL